MKWSSLVGPLAKLVIIVVAYLAKLGARRRGRLEQREAQLEQDARDARMAADAGRAVVHDTDSVLADPQNRDNAGQQ